MGLFAPFWTKNDPKSEKKTLEYVAGLADQAKLAQILRQSPSFRVKKETVRKITDQKLLASVVTESATLAGDAFINLTDSDALQYILDHDRLSSHRIRAAAKLPDHARGQQVIGEAAMHDREESVRLEAVQLLDDEEILTQVADSGGQLYRVIMAAIGRISDSRLLSRIVRECKDSSGKAYAITRISDPELKEESCRYCLANPEGGTDAWQTSLECTDHQDSIFSLICLDGPHRELKIKAVRKLTDEELLNRIIRSDDERFHVHHYTFMPGTSQSVRVDEDLKTYAESRLEELAQQKAGSKE